MNLQFNNKGQRREDLLFFNFNQDYSCISIGSLEGFSIFRCEPFTKAYDSPRDDDDSKDGKKLGAVQIAEMLFCTSLIAIVGTGDQPSFSPRKLIIFNTTKHEPICELSFVSSILAVKLNGKRMIVVMDTKIHVYDVSNMKILYSIDTATNSAGLCALCPNDNSYVAYPGTKGDVLMYDALNLTPLNMVEHAHKGAITCLAFNDSGTLLATTSESGTLIRIFSVPEGVKVYEFRRGSQSANIYSMAFSRDSSLLSLSSDKGTVHIFKLDKTTMISAGESDSVSTSSYAYSFFSDVVYSAWTPRRAFACARLSTINCPNICGFTPNNEHVMVVTAEGLFYFFRIDHDVGGECKIVSEHTLFKSKSEQEAHFLE